MLSFVHSIIGIFFSDNTYIHVAFVFNSFFYELYVM